MGIRLEYSIIILLIITIFFTMRVKLENNLNNTLVSHKELEFKYTTFIEVDTEKMKSKLYTPYGVRENGVLRLKKINYYTPEIDSLISDEGRYRENMLYLDGNVVLKESIGNIYKTEHAVYNQKKEVLRITSDFVAYVGPNIYRGKSLSYDALHKEANATKVHAVIYPEEK